MIENNPSQRCNKQIGKAVTSDVGKLDDAIIRYRYIGKININDVIHSTQCQTFKND